MGTGGAGIATVSTWLRLGRVSNLPTVWTNVLAATMIARGALPPATTALCLLALSAFYTGGMFLNDAFDREIDAVERPERPIPAGLVRARTVFAAGYAQLAVGAFLLVGIGASVDGRRAAGSALAAALLAGAIIGYDMRHKGSAFAPVVMATCRALVYVSVGVAMAGVPGTGLVAAATALLCYVIGLSYVAAQENHRTLSSAWPLVVLAVPLTFCLQWIAMPTLAGPLTVFFGGWVLFALSFLVRARPDPRGAVTRLIAGICAFDAVVIAAHGSAAVSLCALGLLALTRLFQRFVPGT